MSLWCYPSWSNLDLSKTVPTRCYIVGALVRASSVVVGGSRKLKWAYLAQVKSARVGVLIFERFLLLYGGAMGEKDFVTSSLFDTTAATLIDEGCR